MNLKLGGYLLVAFVILWVVISIRVAVKDSRSEILNAFSKADRIELRLLNYGPGYLCDAELKGSLIRVLRSLEPTDSPPRLSCSMVHIVARTSTGQEITVLDLLTTKMDHGLFGMAGEKNYSSAHLPELVHLIRVKYPGLELRFFNEMGRCE